ncbi:MAG: ABC transporter permease, partial [Longimicrobiales bacterium]|nr:ABC transporter permease [Longimicrobiales bacterium]
MNAFKLSLRNLLRNRWRSGLTLAAVAVAVGLMTWTLSFYEGWLQAMIRGATAVETAQVQIHAASYVDQPRVYRSFTLDSATLDRIRDVPDVRALSPRVELFGLVGNEERSQVGRILGVDPVLESRATPIGEAIIQGRWLSENPPEYPAPREVVLGSGVAQQLRVEPGAELVTFLEAADGSLGNELLRVVGVARTGNTAVDRNTVYMHLDDAQLLGALDDEIHEVAIRTADLTTARRTAEEVARAIGVALVEDQDALVVRSWQAILPGIDQMVVLFRRSYWILYMLVYLLAAAGIVNTQRMSALERRREFGVMVAIGMRPRRLLGTLTVETTLLGVLGALIGTSFGTALAWYHSTRGFDMSLLTDEAAFSYMGVAFSERL